MLPTIVKPPVPDFANDALTSYFNGDFDQAVKYFEDVVLYLKRAKVEKVANDQHKIEVVKKDANDLSAYVANEKFLSDKSNFVLKYGDKKDFLAGLESYIGRPKNPHILECMRDEHNATSHAQEKFSPSNNPQLVTTPAEEWLFVTDPVAYGDVAASKKRVILPRQTASIADLMLHEVCVKAGLKEAELVAGRLYTGPMFVHYNDMLRNPQAGGRQSYVYTIHAFASCIVKLSRVHRITMLYRGIKGGALPQAFLQPDEYGARGGVEYGFMSTTTDKRVAYDYAQSKDGAPKAAVIYEIAEGAIDRGADVSWLSQFPTESEVVFPPLTNLEVFGEPKAVDGAIVTTLRVNINLRTLTVDEIVEKSRTQFLNMLDWYFEEVRTARLDFDPSVVLPTWLGDFTLFKDEMWGMEGSWFNQHEFYRKAVDEALDLKEGSIHKVRVLKLLGELDVGGVHDAAAFARTLERLRATRASEFANLKFVTRYVAATPGSLNEDGDIAMCNYDTVWSLPVQKGSWATLVCGDIASTPIRVTSTPTRAQLLREFLFSFKAVKGLWRQLLGYVVVDALLGTNGCYYCVGLSAESGKPFYQLSRKEGSLSCKYIYFKGGRWYVGSVLDSEWADLRSMTEDDASPADVRQWGKTTAPALWAYIRASQHYVPDADTRVRNYNDVSFGVFTGDEESHVSASTSPLYAGWGLATVQAPTLTPTQTQTAAHVNADDVASPSHHSQSGGAESAMSLLGAVGSRNVMDGRKWAFVHRMLEEQTEQDQGRGNASSVGARIRSAGTNTPQPLGKQELQSLAVFCEQARCHVPKEVTNYLRAEGTNAQFASALLSFAVSASIVVGGFFIATLAEENFNSADYNTLEVINNIVWGYILALCVIAWVFFSVLITTLLGKTASAAFGVTAVAVLIGTFFYTVYIMCGGMQSTSNNVRGALAVIVDLLGVMVVAAILYSFLGH